MDNVSLFVGLTEETFMIELKKINFGTKKVQYNFCIELELLLEV